MKISVRLALAVLIAAPLSVAVVWFVGVFQAGLESTAVPAGPAPQRMAAYEEPEVSFAPTPEFVVEIAAPEPDPALEQRFPGVTLLLFDRQQYANDAEITHYFRQVFEVETLAGAAQLTQVPVPFDPVLQSVSINSLYRTRDGVRTDIAEDLRFELVRPDAANMTQMFTGEVIAMLRLPNLQPGDRVELAYTINERFIIPGQRVSSSFWATEQAVSHQSVYYRSSWSRGAVKTHALGGAEVIEPQEVGDRIVFEMGPSRLDVSPPEAFVPLWHYPSPGYMTSTWADWNEVANWASGLFEPVVTDEVRAIADQIMAEHPSQDARIMEALRWVQREIRYHAVLLGSGGYVPLHPDETLRYAEGDCKAKTLLLLSILQAMGVEAHAALVHTAAGPGIDALPPTALAFNHIIVTVMDRGRPFWLDPTAVEQSGTLRDQPSVHWGFALVAASGTQHLTEISVDLPRAPGVDLDERISILNARRDNHTAILRANWTYRREAANGIRNLIASHGVEAYEALIQDYYGLLHREVEPVGTMSVAESETENAVTLGFELRVELHDFSRPGASRPSYLFVAHGPSRQFLYSSLEGRRQALALPFPYDVRHYLEVSLPEGSEDWALPEEIMHPDFLDFSVDNVAFDLSERRRFEDRRLSLTARTRILSPELRPDDFDRISTDLYSIDPLAITMIGEVFDVAYDPETIGGYWRTSHPPALPAAQ